MELKNWRNSACKVSSHAVTAIVSRIVALSNHQRTCMWKPHRGQVKIAWTKTKSFWMIIKYGIKLLILKTLNEITRSLVYKMDANHCSVCDLNVLCSLLIYTITWPPHNKQDFLNMRLIDQWNSSFGNVFDFYIVSGLLIRRNKHCDILWLKQKHQTC